LLNSKILFRIPHCFAMTLKNSTQRVTKRDFKIQI
jgi:hypothetical protein